MRIFSMGLKLFFLNAYETGVWNWSMKLEYETEVWNAYETGVWNDGCSWIQHQHILDASMDCMQGYIYAWIHGSCMDRLRQLVWNGCETDLKLTYNRPGCIYICYTYIKLFFFGGAKRFCRGVGLFMTNWSSKNRTSLYSTPRDTWPLSCAAASHASVLQNARVRRSAAAPCLGGLSPEVSGVNQKRPKLK